MGFAVVADFVEASLGLFAGMVRNFDVIRHRGILKQRAVAPAAVKAPRGASDLCFCTANLTTAGPMASVLDNVKGRIWLVQEHHLRGNELALKEELWLRQGHKFALAPAATGKVLR